MTRPAMPARLAPRSARKLSIVVGLDFSEADGPAFEQAARIVQPVLHSQLHLIHVSTPQPSEERARDLVDRLRLQVNERAAAVDGLGGIIIGIHLRAGNAAREIARLASDVEARLIVVGSRRGPFQRHWLVGSTTDCLMVDAPCPVLVAIPRSRGPGRDIEPPCSRCIEARAGSAGERWWCARHTRSESAARAFSYQRDLPFASHDSEIIPTGR